VIFSENKQLFGFDGMERIVAVEFSIPNQIKIFVREPNGSTSVQTEEFSPFLWTSSAGIALAGALTLDQLMTFPDWRSYQEARSRLTKEQTPLFAFNDPVQQYLTFSGRTLFKGMRFEDLRRLQIGVQAAVSDDPAVSASDRESISAISLSDSSGWEQILVVERDSSESERTALEALTTTIQERDPDVIEGHNLFKSDLPLLFARAKKLKVRLAWGREGSSLSSRPSRLQIAEKLIQYPKFTVRGRHIADSWVLAQFYDVSSRELETFGLENIARHFRVSEKDRVSFAPERIHHASLEDPEAFRTYALQNVREVRSLAAILSRSYFVQAQIFPYNYQDVIIRGNATKIDALFLREYLRRRHSIPDFPEVRPFEGGYTDIFHTGIIEGVWHCDVTSLYPSLMLAFGFLPKNDALSVLEGMLRDLRAFRVEAKNALRAAEDPLERGTLDALQGTFKILINSIYGYLGFAQGHFADFDAAENVTAKGREILRCMVKWLEEHGAKVIEIDTDGIYFRPPEGVAIDDLRRGLTTQLQPGIEVELDKRYRAMFSYKAKNYALLDDSGALIIKGGALKSRGMEPYLRDYLEAFLRLLLNGESEKAALLREEMSLRIRRREMPIASLAKTEALQDSVASYTKKITASSRNRSAAFELAIKSGRNYQAGDQISYYITGTSRKVTAYENAKLASEWNPEARDENIDYYVSKLDELAARFIEFASKRPVQPDLFVS
jgi:DNA polymerase, archaea type